MTQFCTIAPTAFLEEFAEGRPAHLLLAHLVEEDATYRNWYVEHKKRHPNVTYIMDNSAFEMYKQGRPMYESGKLIKMGKAVNADYVVLSDYPAEPGKKTIDAARELAPQFHAADLGTFFCPQSRIYDLPDLLDTYRWAVSQEGNELVDYIGLSILGIPNAYGVEKGNKLQRYCARAHFMHMLEDLGILQQAARNYQQMHALGMVDGPNEILLLRSWLQYIDTWDSSSPIWAGLNGIVYDGSPTGLMDGKFEKEVDFAMSRTDVTDREMRLALDNLEYIDSLLG